MQLPKGVVILALLASGISAAAQSIVQTREVLTNPSIVTLASAGFNEDFLIELILNSKTEFDTSISRLATLMKQGINERIIRVMLRKPSAAPVSLAADPQPASPAREDGPRVAVSTKDPSIFAIATHTPYSDSRSLFWGFVKKRIDVGVAPQGRDALAQHLGAAYGSVLALH